MKILIYTFGNHKMGMGHIYRMLNLADLLEKKKHEVLFLLPSWVDGLKKIKEQRKEVIQVPINFFEQESLYAQLLKDYVFDYIIVDALQVPERIMRLFQKKSKILLSLDNVGQGRFFSDILINILYRQKPKLKEPKIEINNFSYLVLNKNFKKFNLKKKIINKKVKKILITQGGSDTYGIVPKIVNSLSSLLRGLEVYVLVGPAFKHRKELISSIRNNNLKIKILENVEETWKLFYEMDMAISAGGMTLFELLCAGVPCMVLTQERKEIETINYLKNLDLIIMLGLYEKIQNNDLLNKTLGLMEDYDTRIKMSEKGKQMIDGEGCERTACLIEDYFNKFKLKI